MVKGRISVVKDSSPISQLWKIWPQIFLIPLGSYSYIFMDKMTLMTVSGTPFYFLLPRLGPSLYTLLLVWNGHSKYMDDYEYSKRICYAIGSLLLGEILFLSDFLVQNAIALVLAPWVFVHIFLIYSVATKDINWNLARIMGLIFTFIMYMSFVPMINNRDLISAVGISFYFLFEFLFTICSLSRIKSFGEIFSKSRNFYSVIGTIVIILADLYWISSEGLFKGLPEPIAVAMFGIYTAVAFFGLSVLDHSKQN